MSASNHDVVAGGTRWYLRSKNRKDFVVPHELAAMKTSARVRASPIQIFYDSDKFFPCIG